MPSTLIYFLVTWLGIVGSHAEIHSPGDLFQRDDVFVPERVDIPIFYDEDGRYVASVIMVWFGNTRTVAGLLHSCGRGSKHSNFP